MSIRLLLRTFASAAVAALLLASGCDQHAMDPGQGSPSVTVAFATEQATPTPEAIARLVDKVRALSGAEPTADPRLGKSLAAFVPDEARIVVLDATQWKSEEQLMTALAKEPDTLYNFSSLSITGDLWDNLVSLLKGYNGSSYRYAGEYYVPVFFGAGRGIISVNPGLNMFFAALREGRRTVYLYYSVVVIPAEGETTLLLSPLDIVQRLLSNVGMWERTTGWHAMAGGTNGEVTALKMVGGTLIVGGSFTVAGSTSANSIAVYDTSSRRWSALGAGLSNPVAALEIHMNTLYALTNSRLNITAPTSTLYRWSGATWVQVGPTISGRGNALATDGTRLYIGGSFSQAGGVTLDNVAVWTDTSTTFSALSGGTNGAVYGIAIGGAGAPLAFMGGSFSRAGAVPSIAVSNLARWDTRNWTPVGTGSGGVSGTASAIRSVLFAGGGLYVGGTFSSAELTPVSNVALYSGNLWLPLGLGIGGPVRALATDGVNIYAGGLFQVADGVGANNIAFWNGAGWLPLGGGVDGQVNAIATAGATVFAGGSFRYTK